MIFSCENIFFSSFRSPWESKILSAPPSNLEIGCTQTIIDYTKKGLGVTILPEFTVTPFIENKTLSVINVRDSEIEMEIQLIYRNDIWLSPAAKEFISEFQI